MQSIGGTTGPRVREWKENLPPRYRLREDADLLVLLGPDGSQVASLKRAGGRPLEVIAVREDQG